ncbi:hypothetical protein BpHYR1_015609 [Brachionus plicatilis]|uniref:Uncharacterized protein n=1 Tax=Brachionus plicatilis TaxID=10195 RepID=A0A3M7PRP0_BRAPC|nr:hypothetical protein BpHYR1_015609 [Brachionus plicatilis]
MSYKSLTPSDNICFLGIRFDHSLSFKNQFENSESSTASVVRRPTQADQNDTDNDIEETTIKARRESKVYDQYKTYDSLERMSRRKINSLVEDTTWGAKERRKTESGEKRHFKCSKYIEHDHNSQNFGTIPTKTNDKYSYIPNYNNREEKLQLQKREEGQEKLMLVLNKPNVARKTKKILN